MAFIDGDHTREGVARDTALVRAALAGVSLCVIVWHDYQLGPVRTFIDADARACHVAGTNCCFEIIRSVH
jgi:hypothetical protein